MLGKQWRENCVVYWNIRTKDNRQENVTKSVEYISDFQDQDLQTRFLQIQKNQLIGWHDNFERYRNLLPVFDFHSAKDDKCHVKSNLIPNLVY